VDNKGEAFGHPGIEARWTSSSKEGIGTALADASPVWFTLAYGILNEIYFPRVDCANTRDAQYLITDGRSFSTKKNATSIIIWIMPTLARSHFVKLILIAAGAIASLRKQSRIRARPSCSYALRTFVSRSRALQNLRPCRSARRQSRHEQQRARA
jgi:hypothetical protein